MAIVITKRPYTYCFAGNPVHYELYSELAATDPDVHFEVRVLFKTNVAGGYAATDAIPYHPAGGYATINIQDILDGLLEYELPGFNADEKTIWRADKQTGSFYLQYREPTSANPDPYWDDTELAHSSFVMKGGISHFKYQGNNFWVNYFNVKKPFFTWQKRSRLAALTERMYLLFLNNTAAEALKAYAKVYYTDGTNATVEKELNLPLTQVAYFIPAGAEQWGLPALNVAKTIYYWEIYVRDVTAPLVPVTVSEIFKYEADNRHDYNDITLNYRNSLGGLDSLRVRGVIEYGLEYDFAEQERTIQPDYFDGHYFTPQRVIANSREKVVYKGNAGHMDREEQDRLRDSNLQRESWWEVAKKWLPVSLLTRNMTLKKSDDFRFSFPIEFTLAYDGDHYYTPDNEDLGGGVFTDNVCLAYVSITTETDLSGADPQVTLTMIEQDVQNASTQFRYRVIKLADNSVAIDWVTDEYAPQVFNLPKGFYYMLEVQSICTNGIFGRTVTKQINTTAIAGESGPCIIINNSSVGSVYSIAINGVAEASDYVGANTEDDYAVGNYNLVLAQVVLTLTSLSPSSARMKVGSGLWRSGTIAGNVVTFPSVFGINNNITIELF